MQKQPVFADADAYVASLDGWRRACVERLRASVLTQGKLQETVKWGHLVYEANGPVLLIRAEPQRVLFGFWRGQRLRGIEPALLESGKYEMATIEIREGMPVDAATAKRLAEAAVALNEELGDPRLAAKPRQSAATKAKRTTPVKRPSRGARKPGPRRAKTSQVTRAGNKKDTASAGADRKSPALRAKKRATSSRRSGKGGRRGG
jgi:hypothetical protein